MQIIKWTIKKFNNLSVNELFEILYLRSEVFIVEQNCPYQDVDEKDRNAFHLFGIDESGHTIAVSRILPKGISYEEISIGRVTVKKEARGEGIGDKLMQESLKFIKQKFGDQNIRISAQRYLLGYYQKHGFNSTGKLYLEDNIPHVEMLYNKE